MLKGMIIERVKSNRKDIKRFLGYSDRPAPKVIEKKIDEELEKFGDFLSPQYHYRMFTDGGHSYVDILYSIGSEIEEPIKGYTAASEAMRGMILDKIAVVSLDALKAYMIEEIEKSSGKFVSGELYPGSPGFPLEMQRVIHAFVMEEGRSESLETDGTDSGIAVHAADEAKEEIVINAYHQLFPLKSVALRLSLAPTPVHVNRCTLCSAPCEMAKTDEESMYLYFKKKAAEVTRAYYANAGLSEDIYADNMADLEIWADEYEAETGKRGIAKIHWSWIEKILDFKVIKLGRLQFEPYREALSAHFPEIATDDRTLYLNVHIRKGEPFHDALCLESYQKAITFFTSYLPEGKSSDKVIFLCDSWLLNPRLKELLGGSKSNILDFQSRYRIIGENSDYLQIEERVFSRKMDDPHLYPELTTLQKNLKCALVHHKKYGRCRGYFTHYRGNAL
ncbi:MAG: acyltransferase domain-containing protein [Bacillota bacterium]|nr:acyltransferase domain-containing protein [Bacillota bacterium]